MMTAVSEMSMLTCNDRKVDGRKDAGVFWHAPILYSVV